MNQNQQQVLAALNYSVTGQNIQNQMDLNSTNAISMQYNTGSASNALYVYPGSGTTLWKYWHEDYYPHVIKESYPVYIQERAMDKGKQAFEILKALMDKGLVKVDKVKDFIEAMDILLKTL